MQGKIAADEEGMRRSGLHFGHEKKKINVPVVKEIGFMGVRILYWYLMIAILY